MSRKNILVINDDGIYGVGLKPLVKELDSLGKVTVVVPEHERSAASHAITLHKPIRVSRLEQATYIINGTPADCARFGALNILEEKVDLLISGINRGANMGADTIYSGTVGGAMEGCMLGVSSFAVSLQERGRGNYRTAAQFAKSLAKRLLQQPLSEDVFLNVNVPDRPKNQIKGVAVTQLGKRLYNRDLTSRVDPRGLTYYWLAGETPRGIPTPGSDITAVKQGKISVTPLHLDLTDHDMIPGLRRWEWNF